MGQHINPLNLNIRANKNVVYIATVLMVLILLFFGIVGKVYAASIYFSPSSGSYTVGTSFQVSIFTGSSDQAMNAASGVVSFPSDKVEVISVSKNNSVFNLWVEEPSFSNSVGTVNFEGVVLNPGFTGSAGKVLTITFKAKTAGTVPLTISSASVLANDGQGTDILSTLGKAQFSIQSGESRTTTTKKSAVSDEDALTPKITSATHPNTNEWYQNSNPEFSWTLPSDVVEVQTLVGSKPLSIPVVSYRPAISQKTVEDMPDGVWYFHLRFRNASGFGEITHFKFNIDTEKPERFEIKEIRREDATNPRAQFIFDAEDKTSGIDYYEINIDGEDQTVWKDSGDHTFVTNALPPGTHTLIAKAVDKAGNSRSNSIEFKVNPLLSPVFDEYPSQLEIGDPLVVRGDATYKDAEVTIWLKREKDEPKTYYITNDENGKFVFTLDERLEIGTYALWAVVTDERDAKSNSSEEIIIEIKRVSLVTIGSFAISVLAVIVPLIVLVISLFFVLWYGWNKFNQFRRRMRSKITHTESTMHKAFKLLRGDIEEHIRLLRRNKRRQILTKEEHKLLQQLEKSLEEAEYILEEEIEDVKEEIGG